MSASLSFFSSKVGTFPPQAGIRHDIHKIHKQGLPLPHLYDMRLKQFSEPLRTSCARLRCPFVAMGEIS